MNKEIHPIAFPGYEFVTIRAAQNFWPTPVTRMLNEDTDTDNPHTEFTVLNAFSHFHSVIHVRKGKKPPTSKTAWLD
jgi:hypothetical protein